MTLVTCYSQRVFVKDILQYKWCQPILIKLMYERHNSIYINAKAKSNSRDSKISKIFLPSWCLPPFLLLVPFFFLFLCSWEAKQRRQKSYSMGAHHNQSWGWFFSPWIWGSGDQLLFWSNFFCEEEYTHFRLPNTAFIEPSAQSRLPATIFIDEWMNQLTDKKIDQSLFIHKATKDIYK